MAKDTIKSVRIIDSLEEHVYNVQVADNKNYFAGGILVHNCDDPLNPKQAASAVELKSANDFFDKTLPTRKVDKAVTPTYLVMQRLNVNDPTGHLLAKKKDIYHICLPATLSSKVKPERYKSHYIDGFLDPVRLGPSALAELRIDLGSASYAGQIDQVPVPEGGLIWQKWFIEVPDESFPHINSASQVGTDWDLAYTKEEKNSASAYITSGMIGNNIFLFDFDWKWLEFPELIKWMKSKSAPHFIENKASGKSSRQTLQKHGIPAIEVKVSSDKIARAKDATPTAEAGLVFIKRSMADKLYSDPKQGILFFPNGEQNDIADVLSQCLIRRTKKNKMVVGDENAVAENVPVPGKPDINLLDYI